MDIAQMSALLGRLEVQGPAAMAGALDIEAQETLRAALVITPIEHDPGPGDPPPGTLRASGHLRPFAEGVEVVFDADFAIFVHERLDTDHAPPTRAKFLESAALERMPGFSVRVGEHVRRAMGT